MTVEVPIPQIGKYVEAKLDKLVRQLVLEADEAIKVNSPVDLGRFRASWMIGENSTSSTPQGPGKRYNMTKATGSNYLAGREKIGKTYSIHNNLPYAEKLCFGSGGSGRDCSGFSLQSPSLCAALAWTRAPP